MHKWGIICPSPSLSRYNLTAEVIKTTPDILVAVNGAILSWFDFKYWIIQDLELFETVFNKWQGINHTGAILFFPDRWLMDIPRDFPKMNKFFNSFTQQPFASETVAAFNLTMPFGKELDWREYTKFMAIALAIHEGARQIYLFGDDMSGSGYFTPGLENCRTQHTERRWGDELQKTTQIFDLCLQSGILIQRILTPKNSPDTQEGQCPE